MGASARGALDDEPGCHQTSRETDQVDRAPEVSPPVPKAPDDGRFHARHGACSPYVYVFPFFGSSDVDGGSFIPRMDFLRPDPWDVAGVAHPPDPGIPTRTSLPIFSHSGSGPLVVGSSDLNLFRRFIVYFQDPEG